LKPGNRQPNPTGETQGLRGRWTRKHHRALKTSAVVLMAHLTGLATSKHAQHDIFINSQLTAGEDIADLGGQILAW